MLKISNLSFSYGSEAILDRLSLNLPSRRLVAIIGDNGTGKTTLLRLIAGQLTPDDGSIWLTGRVGYLPQDHHNDILSGGEIVRAKLRELFEAHYDCLVLDEPTNNLDARARQWLVGELRRFNGLAIIVSHDRRFIDAVVGSLVVIKAGKAKLYGGNYRDYQERVKQAEAEQWEEYAKAKLERKRLNKRMVAAKSRAHSADNSHFDKLKHEEGLSKMLRAESRVEPAGKSGSLRPGWISWPALRSRLYIKSTGSILRPISYVIVDYCWWRI